VRGVPQEALTRDGTGADASPASLVDKFVDKRLPLPGVTDLDSQRDVDHTEGASIRGGDHVLLLRSPRSGRWHPIHSGGLAGAIRLSSSLPLPALPGASRARSGLAPVELTGTVCRLLACEPFRVQRELSSGSSGALPAALKPLLSRPSPGHYPSELRIAGLGSWRPARSFHDPPVGRFAVYANSVKIGTSTYGQPIH
jgi:hypothetical protein